MNASHDSGNKSRKSLGQRLDEVLEPFLKDRARLQTQLREQKQLRVQIEQQIKESQRDLEVVEHSMLQALREAAKSDPLLSAAFHLDRPADAQAEPVTADVGPLPELNPLLKPEAERA